MISVRDVSVGPVLVGTVLAGAALAGTGCTQQAPGPEAQQPVVTVSEPSGSSPDLTATEPSESSPDLTATEPTSDRPIVDVHTRYDVPPDEATRALVAFVRARTESVIAGHDTPELARLTTEPEHRRQLANIRFALRQGYTVPTDPWVAVVTRQRRSFGQVLGVCLWLPSVEFVDPETGQPPSGPVPQRWAPALATLRQQTVTWKVDKLSAPADPGSITCGG